MSEITYLLEILGYILGFNTESNPHEQKAIAPLAIMGISAGAQALYGAYQKNKAGKMNPDNAKAEAALKAKEANQKELISRAKTRDAISTERPGTSRAESEIAASTANAVGQYKELGNQSGYQDFLNKALQTEQDTLAGISTENAIYKDRNSLAVDEAIGGMQDVYDSKYQHGMNEYEGDLANKLALSGAGDQNIMGSFNTGASALMMGASNTGGDNRLTKEQRQGRRAERRYNRRNS